VLGSLLYATNSSSVNLLEFFKSRGKLMHTSNNACKIANNTLKKPFNLLSAAITKMALSTIERIVNLPFSIVLPLLAGSATIVVLPRESYKLLTFLGALPSCFISSSNELVFEPACTVTIPPYL